MSIAHFARKMKTIRWLRFSLPMFALLLCSITEASAQILYIQLVSTNPERFQLRQVNGDGSGDTGIGLPFADVRFPAWSRDGAVFAITASDPNRPNDRGKNVFAINAATGAIQQVTFFQDLPPDSGGTFSWHLPFYKAFSPDRSAIAVSRFFVNGSGSGTGGVTPVLEVYSGGNPNPIQVHVHRDRTFTNHGLEGVDWHATQNVLVTPLESSARFLSNPNFSGEVTALFFLEPVPGAVNQGRARQVTFPRADQNPGFFQWGEHDYSPKVSPNGVGVAYVRSFQNRPFGPQDPNIQSLRILNLNTGADTEVLRLPPGTYVSGLDWSPDGTALVFDLGQQRNGINGLEQNAVPETIEIHIVNVDGTGLRRLRGAGAAAPAWKPLGGNPPPNTPTGNNITVQSPSGDASVTFPSVSQAGTTNFAPINPSSAGTPPAGFTILNNAPAFDITTSAAFTPPVTVCHIVSSISDAGTFERVRILHGENGQLVDRTILAPDAPASDFATRRVCARVNSLSPFVTALAPAASPTPTPTPTPSPSPSPGSNVVQFSASDYNVQEDCTFVTVTVNRAGDTSGTASVDYKTSDVVATERKDYITALGKLQFAAGETSKSFVVLINEDSFVEGNETLYVTLSNPSGASLGGSAISSVTITDDAAEPAMNAIDDARNYVCQSYHDFLNRQPDPGGWDFWTNQITSCGSDLACLEARRINVSASFFLSIEFQQTGYLVERTYKTAFGDATGGSTFGGAHQLPVPIARFLEFLSDSQLITNGVIVLQPGWEQLLEANKQAFFLEFVQRPRFTTALPTTMTPTEFVDKLNQNVGNLLSASERTTAINLFAGAGNTTNTTARAQGLRQVAEDQDLQTAEFNRAFVLMQYFGYLRRNPDDPQDTDHSGYDFWLTKLNQFNGNYINAEMVKAFLTSLEYRGRFGQP